MVVSNVLFQDIPKSREIPKFGKISKFRQKTAKFEGKKV